MVSYMKANPTVYAKFPACFSDMWRFWQQPELFFHLCGGRYGLMLCSWSCVLPCLAPSFFCLDLSSARSSVMISSCRVGGIVSCHF